MKNIETSARIRLNAFDKNSGASYSKLVTVFNVKEFIEQEDIFDKEVPFSRFYFDHEFVKIGRAHV